jgi:predicted transcriptional regulator
LKNPTRITISLDEETKELFEKLKEKSRMSQSALLREALRFYSVNKDLLKKTENKKVETYVEMLAGGEHLILDVDHWLLFLKLLTESRNQKDFWEDHRRVARSHAEQFTKKIGTVEGVLERLAVCNFYSLTKLGKNEFVLVLNSNITKKFVKTFIEEVFEGMGLKVEIKDDLAKLRVKSK